MWRERHPSLGCARTSGDCLVTSVYQCATPTRRCFRAMPDRLAHRLEALLCIPEHVLHEGDEDSAESLALGVSQLLALSSGEHSRPKIHALAPGRLDGLYISPHGIKPKENKSRCVARRCYAPAPGLRKRALGGIRPVGLPFRVRSRRCRRGAWRAFPIPARPLAEGAC
jgi:hypothetical protein